MCETTMRNFCLSKFQRPWNALGFKFHVMWVSSICCMKWYESWLLTIPFKFWYYFYYLYSSYYYYTLQNAWHISISSSSRSPLWPSVPSNAFSWRRAVQGQPPPPVRKMIAHLIGFGIWTSSQNKWLCSSLRMLLVAAKVKLEYGPDSTFWN